MLNEAALLAARRNKNVIEMIDCDEAIDRVMVGPERKSVVMSEKEKKNTAYHESGHAVIGGTLEKSDAIHKVTIIPRGQALGLTWSLPDDDRHSITREELIADITMALGGRLAEEIEFGDVTTGASNDFEKATVLARRMVTQYGMSTLGPIQFGRGAHQVFLGRDFGDERNYSEEIASKIDEQVRAIIEAAIPTCRKILDRQLGEGRTHGRIAPRVRNRRLRGSDRDSRGSCLRPECRACGRSGAVAIRRSEPPVTDGSEARREALDSASDDFAGTSMMGEPLSLQPHLLGVSLRRCGAVLRHPNPRSSKWERCRAAVRSFFARIPRSPRPR